MVNKWEIFVTFTQIYVSTFSEWYTSISKKFMIYVYTKVYNSYSCMIISKRVELDVKHLVSPKT